MQKATKLLVPARLDSSPIFVLRNEACSTCRGTFVRCKFAEACFLDERALRHQCSSIISEGGNPYRLCFFRA